MKKIFTLIVVIILVFLSLPISYFNVVIASNDVPTINNHWFWINNSPVRNYANIYIYWPNTGADSYVVELKKDGEAWSSSRRISGSDINFDSGSDRYSGHAYGIDQTKQHIFRVASVTSSVQSAWSSNYTVNLPTVTIAAQSNVKIQNTTDTTITVSWSAVAGVDEYEVHWFTQATNRGGFADASSTQYTFTGLASNTNHEISIGSVINDPHGEIRIDSSLVKTTTLEGDDATKDPQITPTPEVTPTPTPEVTPTQTPEVTPTSTSEVTPTPILEVTPTPTPEATPTPTTTTVTPSPSPLATVSPSPSTTVGAHVHNYVDGVCDCGDKIYWKTGAKSGKYEVTKDPSAPIWSMPISSEGSKQVRRVSKGSVVTVTAVYENKEGNEWYKLKENEYIYSGNVKLYVAPVLPVIFSGWSMQKSINGDYDLGGVITSGSIINSVTIKVKDFSYQTEKHVKMFTNTKNFSMKEMNKDIDFGDLSTGRKILEIWASEIDGNGEVSTKRVYVQAFEVTSVKITKFTLSKYSDSIGINETIQLNDYIQIEPSNATNKEVVWVSENPSVVSIENNKEATARNTGDVKLLATASDGTVKTLTINVTKKVDLTRFVTADPMVIYIAQGTNNRVLGEIPHGAKVKLSEMGTMSINGTVWAKTNFDGKTGWVKYSQLSDKYIALYFKNSELSCHQCPNYVKCYPRNDCKCSGYPSNGLDQELLILLDNIRKKLGSAITVNSGYRCSIHNGHVGGLKKSQHLLGKAADIKPSKGSISAFYKICNELNPNGGVGRYEKFVHVDSRSDRKRWDKR